MMGMCTALIWATINTGVAYVRSSPDYESALETQLLMGRKVEVLQAQGIWREVRSKTPEYTGWTTVFELAEQAEMAEDAEKFHDEFICNATFSNIYSEASLDSQSICPITMGCRIEGASTPCRHGFTPVRMYDGRKGYVPSGDITPCSEWERDIRAKLSPGNVISLGKRFLGTTYLWGGNSVYGFDCSGFTMFLFEMFGVRLPRNASQQARCGKEVKVRDDAGNDIFLKTLKEGDLLFYGNAEGKITHVAIYIGNGRILHSSGTVRICTFREYPRRILTARRVL